MVRTVVVALCLVAVAAGATVAVGHRARSDVVVVVVTVVEHSLGVAGVETVETEVEAGFGVVAVAVLRLRSWSSSMASTHLPGLALVLAARRQPVTVGMIVVVDDVIQVVPYKRRYRGLDWCIGLTEPHMLFEDEAQVGLKAHKPGSLLVAGQIGVVMSFDLREFGIVVAVSRWDKEVVTVAEQGLGSIGKALGRWMAAYLQPGVSAGTTKQYGGHKYLAEGCKSFVEGSLEEGRHRHHHIHMAAAQVDRSDSVVAAPLMILAMLHSLVVLL